VLGSEKTLKVVQTPIDVDIDVNNLETLRPKN